MTDIYESIQKCCENLKLDLSTAELAQMATERELTDDVINNFSFLLKYLSDKKEKATIQDILDKSRLPKKEIKTFENFDFSIVKGRDSGRLQSISSLSTLYSGTNVAFIGPSGIGKTHLAQAYGYECAQRCIKVYFIKASELKDKFKRARKNGSTENCVNTLVRHPCLIIDEIGHCQFDKENTRLFFDVIDRRYHKEGMFNTIFTSNKQPSLWKDCFEEEDALLCALDRIFDDAIVFNLKGKSHRGQNLKLVNIEISSTDDKKEE